MSTSAARAAAFYSESLTSGTVWTVRDAGGIPAPQTRDGERAMPFWSSRSRIDTVRATVAAYRDFEAFPIPLSEWRDRWLPGLRADGLLVGLNWAGPRATGYDVDPDDVLTNLNARGG